MVARSLSIAAPLTPNARPQSLQNANTSPKNPHGKFTAHLIGSKGMYTLLNEIWVESCTSSDCHIRSNERRAESYE